MLVLARNVGQSVVLDDRITIWSNIIYDNVGVANNLPLAAAAGMFPIVIHRRLPARGAPYRRAREPVEAVTLS